MILPDTSVWIEFLKQDPYITPGFTTLLEKQEIVTIEPVFSELLYGVRTRKDREVILSYWQLLYKIPFEPGSMLDAADYANHNNFHNLGIGLMDATIIFPVTTLGIRLWTLDKRIVKAIDSKYTFTL